MYCTLTVTAQLAGVQPGTWPVYTVYAVYPIRSTDFIILGQPCARYGQPETRPDMKVTPRPRKKIKIGYKLAKKNLFANQIMIFL